jgi:8-oxo-dGTP pyrophosphatase MutT (NUDIX family)
MIFLEPPENFNSKFDIVSCFFEHDGKFLMLLRQDAKPQGNTWGVPAGKVERNESLSVAMERELEEETGYKATLDPEPINTVYVRYQEYDFVYHIFHYLLHEKPEIIIEPSAHRAFRWVYPEETKEMNLIQDMDSCIKLFYFDRI